MSFRLTACAAATVALLGAGASPAASATGLPVQSAQAIPILRIGELQGYATLDPDRTQGCNTSWCTLFYEHLMTLNPNDQLEPQLATSMQEVNPVTYIFHLRRGVKFWDGDQMTSADVVNSLNYERAPGSETAADYSNVNTITASGPYTVVVTLKKPDASFKYDVTFPGVIFDQKFQEEHKSDMGNPGVLVQATGPWEIDSFDPTTGMQLSANPHWWGGTVPVQHISVTFYASETSEALAMRAGDIDIAFPGDAKSFAATSGARITSYPWNVLTYFGMNTKLAPWSDIHVRRAVAYALNRANLITANGGPSSAIPAYTLIPPDALTTLASSAKVNALIGSLPHYQFNLTMAKQQMAESAYPHGFTATMDTYQQGSTVDVVEVIAAELKKIGITLNVHVMSTDQWLNVIYGPKTFGPMYSGVGTVSPDPSGEPDYILGSSQAKSGGLNFADYTPTSVDELLSQGLATSNSVARFAIYAQLLRNLATDIPYVPLFQSVAYAALSSKFSLPPGEDKLVNFTTWALYIRPA